MVLPKRFSFEQPCRDITQSWMQKRAERVPLLVTGKYRQQRDAEKRISLRTSYANASQASVSSP
jgi:hypothetical protein